MRGKKAKFGMWNHKRWSLLYTVRIWLLLCCTSIHVQWIFRHGEVSVWGCVCMYVCMSILWLKYISCFIYIPSHHMYFYIVRQIQWQTRVIVNLLYDRDTTAGQQNTSMLATEWHTTHCPGWQWPTSFPVLHHSYHHLRYRKLCTPRSLTIPMYTHCLHKAYSVHVNTYLILTHFSIYS